MHQYTVDGNWQRLPDGTPTMQRLIRLNGGMVVGRVLRGPATSRFDAEVFSKGTWQHHGQFDSYDTALRAVLDTARLFR